MPEIVWNWRECWLDLYMQGPARAIWLQECRIFLEIFMNKRLAISSGIACKSSCKIIPDTFWSRCSDKQPLSIWKHVNIHQAIVILYLCHYIRQWLIETSASWELLCILYTWPTCRKSLPIPQWYKGLYVQFHGIICINLATIWVSQNKICLFSFCKRLCWLNL